MELRLQRDFSEQFEPSFFRTEAPMHRARWELLGSVRAEGQGRGTGRRENLRKRWKEAKQSEESTCGSWGAARGRGGATPAGNIKKSICTPFATACNEKPRGSFAPAMEQAYRSSMIPTAVAVSFAWILTISLEPRVPAGLSNSREYAVAAPPLKIPVEFKYVNQ